MCCSGEEVDRRTCVITFRQRKTGRLTTGQEVVFFLKARLERVDDYTENDRRVSPSDPAVKETLPRLTLGEPAMTPSQKKKSDSQTLEGRPEATVDTHRFS